MQQGGVGGRIIWLISLQSYIAWEARVDASLFIDAGLVESALGHRVLRAVEGKDNDIVCGGVEGGRGEGQGRFAILILANLHVVGLGKGEWEDGKREKGGDMHDVLRW